MDVSKELGNINSEPLGGDMGGMEDMNAPMPPMDAEQPPMDDAMAGGDPNAMGDPGMGEDPMPGDPNALSAGQGDEPNTGNQKLDSVISQVKQESDNPDKKLGQLADYGEKGLGLNTTPMQSSDAQMPMESKFNFKHIIDEIFGEVDGNVRPLDRGMERPETKIAQEALTDDVNPFLPK